MQINEVSFGDAMPVDGYGPGFFRLGGEILSGAILTSPLGAQSWGGFEALEPLLALSGVVDVLFIGTGAEIAHAPESLRHALEDVGVGVETMASPAACRTYNVLLAEGRRVALAALPV